MATTLRFIEATPTAIFDTLVDPYAYAHWVVGSKEIRGADDDWPAVGSAFYHRVGSAGLEVKDKSEVIQLDPPHWMALRTYVRPLGIAIVAIDIDPHEGGSLVTIHEVPHPGTRLNALSRLLDPLIHLRNIESLRRLDRLVRIRALHPVPVERLLSEPNR